jgi:hypothetical protein
MTSRRRSIAAVCMIGLSLSMAACGHGSRHDDAEGPPAQVGTRSGSAPRTVTLTAAASKRLDVQLATVTAAATGTQIPYAAVLYDPKGETWAFVSTSPLTFVRAPIAVDRIDGDTAVLKNGPPAGSKVVTVGATELYGTELGVGHGE